MPSPPPNPSSPSPSQSTLPSSLAAALLPPPPFSSIPTSPYHHHTWPEVRSIILANRLDVFHRTPEELQRYKKYCAGIREEWGSMMEFIVKQRLGWEMGGFGGKEGGDGKRDRGEEVREEEWEGLGDDSHTTLLPNDWPYALDPSITHLVLWTRRPIPSDPTSAIGDLSPTTRAKISRYINARFAPAVHGDATNRVVWFRNWGAIKSVHAVEHVHVLLLQPERAVVEGWTGERMR